MPLNKPFDLVTGLGLGYLSFRFIRSAFADGDQEMLAGLAAVRQDLVQRISGSQLADPSNPAGNGPLSAKKADIVPIEGRVKVIAQLVREGHEHPYLVEMTRKVLSKKRADGSWMVPEKDWKAETQALFDFVRKNVRYVRDPALRDSYFAGERTLAQGGGDCDDYAVLLGSMLMAAGQRVKLRVVQTMDAPTWNHIYLLTSPDGSGDEWIPLDASVAKPAGWEVPGAADVARTGKPAGEIKKVKDFLVT